MSEHACTVGTTPPAHELAFGWQGRQWVALLWWCPVDEVWDVIVYETRGGRFRWQCSGVARKRFVEVKGSSTSSLRRALWEAIGAVASGARES